MSTFTQTVKRNVYSNSLVIQASADLTGDVEAAINQTIAASAANIEILVAVDVSAVKCVALLSSTDCTVKTNSSGAPANTITLVAGQPYIWHTDEYAALLLTTDVTKIFVTNGEAVEQTFQMLVLT